MEPQDTSSPTMNIKNIAFFVYGCWAGGVLAYVISPLGILPIVGAIVAYLKQKEAAGTIYASHFTWMMRSIAGALAVVVVGMILMWIPGISIVGILLMFAVGILNLYRLVKGGLRLLDGKPIENPLAYY